MRINHAGLERLETNLQFYPNLILCDLSHNRLSTLTPYAFESQSQLNRLSVSNNRVATIYKESLHGLVNLQSLDLSHNKLTHLGANLFAQMNTLTDLDLSANSIGSIHRMAFEVRMIALQWCSLLICIPSLIRNTTKVLAVLLSAVLLTDLVFRTTDSVLDFVKV